MTPTTKILPVIGAVAAMTLLPGPSASARGQGPTLTGRAILAAETTADGPTSGAALESVEGGTFAFTGSASSWGPFD